jgi:hypothetical protein
MTTSEKIRQLQMELRLLRKLVQSHEDTLFAQRHVMGDLFRQIDQLQSFIPERKF